MRGSLFWVLFLWILGGVFLFFDLSSHVCWSYGGTVYTVKTFWLWTAFLGACFVLWGFARVYRAILDWRARRRQYPLESAERELLSAFILEDASRGRQVLAKKRTLLRANPTGALLLAEALRRQWLEATMEGWVREALTAFPDLKGFANTYSPLMPALTQDVERFVTQARGMITKKMCPRAALRRYVDLFAEGQLPAAAHFEVFCQAIEQLKPAVPTQTHARGLYQMALAVQASDPLKEEALLQHAATLWPSPENPALGALLLLLFQKNNEGEMRGWIERVWAQDPWIEGAFLYTLGEMPASAFEKAQTLASKNPSHVLSHYLLWEHARTFQNLPVVYDTCTTLEQHFEATPRETWPAWMLPLQVITDTMAREHSLPPSIEKQVLAFFPLRPSADFWALVEARRGQAAHSPSHERLDHLLAFR